MIIAITPTTTPTAIPAFAPVASPLDCVSLESSETFVDVVVEVASVVLVVCALVVCDAKSADRQRMETPFALMPSAVVVKLDVVPPLVKYQTDEWVFREVHRFVFCQFSVGDSVCTA